MNRLFSFLIIFLFFSVSYSFAQDSLKRQINDYLLQQDRRKKAQKLAVDQKRKLDSLQQITEAERRKSDSLAITLKRKLAEPPPPNQGKFLDVKGGDVVTLDNGTRVQVIPNIGEPDVNPFLSLDTAQYKRRVHSFKLDASKWSSIASSGDESKAYKTKHKLLPQNTIFAWHPTWMEDAYKDYNYDLLSLVSYFSYKVDPATGEGTVPTNWEKTGIRDSLWKHDKKLLLGVSNIGEAANKLFLSKPEAQQTLIAEIKKLLPNKANGVHLDFTLVPRAYKEELTSFIISLAGEVRKIDKKNVVTIAVPAIDMDSAWDVVQLSRHVDFMIINSFEYYGENSEYAGPIAPVQASSITIPQSLENSLKYYVNIGVPSTKLLMGTPYYGAEWLTLDLKLPSRSMGMVSHRMYSTIQEQFSHLVFQTDEKSMTNFSVFKDDAFRNHQVWAEDSLSLALKYDWIIKQKMGGIAIWALGYDHGHQELWRLLSIKFAEPPKAIPPPPLTSFWQKIKSRLWGLLRNPEGLLRNPGMILTTLLAAVGMGGLAVFLIRRFGCFWSRMTVFSLQILLALLILGLICMTLFWFHYLDLQQVMLFLLGFLIAAILVFFITRHFMMEKELP
ncbi:MAG: hypothetical protein EAZ97_07740 [Bacteroidetes bacterium]|nr:MAG: hypothetical protein EAZ97_07740 [Bacteroidota bacterium]